MNKAARHGSLRNEVYEEIREGILRGTYPRGQSLTELGLSRLLGVSRTPIREAFCQLQLDGLVTVTPNKSVVVRGFDNQDIIDLYEIRHQVEALAAEKAAVNMNSELREKIKSTYQEEITATAQQDYDRLQELDSQFHKWIFLGSGSIILQNLLNSLSVYTRQARLTSLTTPGRSKQVLKEHGQVLSAVLNQNSEDARKTMQAHIAHAAANFKAVSQNRR